MIVKPNVILLFMDNLGYGDIGCYGSNLHRTPNLDRMAAEGMRLTSFYSTSGVCTPSRASLMTGCYPRRVNLQKSGNGRCVLFPDDSKGLHPNEITIASLLKSQGYATSCIGKWHLGDQIPFLPTRHGFDEFFGVPYSEDMVPREDRREWPELPLMRGEQVVEAPVDRSFLTKRYTEEGIRFLKENRDRPFFLYMPQAMPGSCAEPFASPGFQGKSKNGIYGDAVEELDWSAGEILKTVQELGLDDNTLVIWTSDNGAVRHDPPQGSNAPLKGWGYDTSEGGQRMPCIVRWSGVVPAGVVRDDLTTTMDILPTVATLTGTTAPADRTIDGHDIGGMLQNHPDFRSSYDDEGFFYYFVDQLQAVRAGQWKLYLGLDKKLNNLGSNYDRAEPFALELYDVRNDIGETTEVSAEYPEIVKRLRSLADKAREELGDWDRAGVGQREAGYVENPTPRVLEVP